MFYLVRNSQYLKTLIGALIALSVMYVMPEGRRLTLHFEDIPVHLSGSVREFAIAVLLAILLASATVPLHEGAHALAGRAWQGRLLYFRCGDLTWYRQRSGEADYGSWMVSDPVSPFSGQVNTCFRPAGQLIFRIRLLTVVAAGFLAQLPFLFVVWRAGQHLTLVSRPMWHFSFVLLSIFGVMPNLISGGSDLAWVLRCVFGGQRLEDERREQERDCARYFRP